MHPDRPAEEQLTHSSLSCYSCRSSKRRCDRTYPECRLCVRKQISCEYPAERKDKSSSRSLVNNNVPQSTTTQASHASPETTLTPSSSLTAFDLDDDGLRAIRFLDPKLYYRLHLRPSYPRLTCLDHVMELVGGVADITEICALFFDTIHTWMPIISKLRFHQELPSRLTNKEKRYELYLLLLSMKLCCSRTSTAKTPLYDAVKRLQFDIESSGITSLQSLQASILIAIYEIGHAIYPAAVLSVGRCSHYAACLGIDSTARPPASMSLPWIEVEEFCRTWWSIVILDRFLSLCDPQRHPVAQDPDANTFLPVDDAAWDSGTSQAADAVTIGTSSTSHLARYARFAQAAHLLTQITTRVPRNYDETTQLRRTIIALVRLAEVEGSWKRWGFCTQMAVCFSGVLILENSWLSPGDHTERAPNDSIGGLSAETVLALEAAFDMITYFFIENNGWTCYRTSPFISHFLYLAASMHASFEHLSLRGPTNRLLALKQALRMVNDRWLAAGVYLSCLEGQAILRLAGETA
ncbi:hypothetical protein NLG97_g31 [Lecanicillium saksenae]|uniref:Uncharacterized protein n=1 Tax=Lecanicillium saksenae TaxID=468837 RepID=A0ACC1RBZ6_9HYPO|nr:hypothetical protein NLG97_g31 [Lecanicillium saksenae]